MNRLPFFDDEQLTRWFRRKKTELSCMEKPQTLLNHLRDHDLIPEDRYKRVISVKSKDRLRTRVYELLDWIEKKQPEKIRPFWTCVFRDSIMEVYPTLKKLHSSLSDGQNLKTRSEPAQNPLRTRSEPGSLESEGLLEKKRVQKRSASPQSTPSKRKRLKNSICGILFLTTSSSELR
ncbi:hypothetical protein NHX12_031892 [Muraenolepis orangiensis]|uniref:HSR domain-containing protein n=1 Tax=Muraenolepis orangiensis TaxID=630683 RepID=A0A9Q0E4N0_9TELE|nr:hypothetical protein NHX12_031892 [Muraenolepis orangiensis]